MKRLAVVLVALVLVAGGAGAYVYAGGFGGHAAEPYALYPTAQQVSSWSFMAGQFDARVERGENPQLVFGSSELNAAPAGATHPGNLLAPGAYDLSVMMAGRAGCADLWHAIEIGAFAGREAAPKRIVLFPSMQWFMCYRRPDQDFPGVFSRGAYDAFMANGQIPDDLKQRVTERAQRYGVACGSDALPPELLARTVDEAARSFVSDMRLARDMERSQATDDPMAGADGPDAGASADAVFGMGPSGGKRGEADAPDWDAVFAWAQAAAREKSTNNDLGLNDAWFSKKYEKWVAGAEKNWKVRDGAYFSEQEFEDFKMVLEVCRAVGVEPLVVLQPVKGAAYDRTIYTREVRAQYSAMMRDACAEAGVAVADVSSHEYDPFFLRDYSHPSELGGAYYSKAIYTYLKTGVADIAPSGGVEVPPR